MTSGSRLFLQALSLVASIVILLYAITFRHPVVGVAGFCTFLYSLSS